jgi:hypothetical protein
MQPALVERISHEFDPSAQAKLSHGIGLVDLDGLDADLQLARDVFVAMTLSHQTQHLRFALGHRWSAFPDPPSFLCGKRRCEVVGQGWIDVLTTAGRCSDGAKQLGVRALLQHIARRPRSEKLLQKGLVSVPGQGHDAEIRPKLFQFPRGLETAHTRHGQVHHHDVEVFQSASRYRLGSIAGLIDHFQIGLPVDQEPQPLAHRLMILHQKYA